MENLVAAATIWGLVIAASLLVGALVATRTALSPRLAAAITAFGGGVLLSAIALELVPDADQAAGPWLTAAGMLGGTLAYVAADRRLNRDQGTAAMRRSGHAAAAGRPMAAAGDGQAARGESIAAGIFIDGVPESIALGLTIAEGQLGVALLAGVLIGNVVEAYGAAQPIVAAGRSARFAVGLLGGIGLTLAVATVAGATVLAGADPAVIGTAQAVAAGAVLAVVSIAVIPHAFDQVSSLVATTTSLGFITGYLLS